MTSGVLRVMRERHVLPARTSRTAPTLLSRDYWYRFEWQARGNPHIHGLFWIKGAPTIDPELHDVAEQANLHGFETFWGPHITAINPHPAQPALDTNPLTVLKTSPTIKDMGAIVNRVHRHACSPYCQALVRSFP
ncbi:hypothetical protein E4U58_001254 [Claviceps cyperi]|nr:hypothetical protein E4U58_001254 [Claviceps cyperi]